MPAHSPIPDIPGELLTDPAIQSFLSQRVAELCNLTSSKFPGSQPVSFTSASLDLLETKDFWVCEKSDGVRVLVFIVMNGMTGNQEVWLIDRKQRYFNVTDLHFPHWENMDQPLNETILDGELVIDIDPKTGQETLRFYAFDCMVLNGENIMRKPLDKRYARLREMVVKSVDKSLKQYPEWRKNLPFEIIAKREELPYHLPFVLREHIPKLQHGHDGLIFTCVETEYIPGTDENILKWKPPSENSIDFKLELRFPPVRGSPDEPDFSAKPEFLLHTWLGGESYEFFDTMSMDDDAWEKVKESGQQLNDRIVEVVWDGKEETWKMMRVRDDKFHANHKSIMEKILISISDGVELDELLARCDAIKIAWKAREQAKHGQPTPGGLPKKPVQTGYTPGGRGPPTFEGQQYGQQQRPAVVSGLKR